MAKKRVLFVCIHNSARSQMAEGLLRELAGDRFDVESAGIEPGKVNPLAIEVMRQAGIDISQASVKSVFELFLSGRLFQYVISVCDESAAEKCPIFPGVTTRLRWSFEDPSRFAGSDAERLAKTIQVRDQIRDRIRRWIDDEEPQTHPLGRKA